MKSPVLMLSRMLMIEQRYQAVKKSPNYADEKNREATKKSIDNFLRVSYTANSISFAVFSFLLISPYVFSGGGFDRITNIGFIVYVYALIISIYSSALFFNSISNMNLLGPVSWLPYDGKRRAVMLSWFLYSGSSSIFSVLPAVAWISWISSNPLVVVFGILWGFLVIMIGYAAGAAINTFVTGRGNRDRAGILSTLKSTMRVMLILLVFAVFEIGIYLPGLIPNFIPGIAFPLNRFLPLVNIPYVVFLGNTNIAGILTDIASTIVYILASLLLMFVANNAAIERSLEGGKSREMFSPEKYVGYRGRSITLSMILKDIRIVARKSQNVILLFIPVVFVFPTILSVLIYGNAGGIGSLGTYFSLTSILVICSSFYSLILVVSEGSGIEALYSLPLEPRDVVYSKAILGLIVFSAIIIPVSVLIMGWSYGPSPYDILIPSNLILGFSYSSIYNIRKLLRKLPKEASTVNFYSFGGGLSIAAMFVTTGGLVLAPVILSAALTAAIFGSLQSSPYIFYLLDSVLNFLALVAVVRITGRTIENSPAHTYLLHKS